MEAVANEIAEVLPPAEHPLTRLRRDRGLSRAKLARLSGISDRALYAVEHGEAKPQWATRVTLAVVLNCAPNDLHDAGPRIA